MELKNTVIDFSSEQGAALKRTYEKNFNALQLTHPETATLIEALRFGTDCLLYADQNFGYGLLRNDPVVNSNSWELLTDFDSIPIMQNSFLPLLPRYELLCLLGTGIGELCMMIADFLQQPGIKNSGNSPEILIIAPDQAMFRAGLYFIDIHDLLSYEKLTIFTGPGYQAKLTEHLDNHSALPSSCLVAVHSSWKSTAASKELVAHMHPSPFSSLDVWGETGPSLASDAPAADSPSICQLQLFDPNVDIEPAHTFIRNKAALEDYPYFFDKDDLLNSMAMQPLQISQYEDGLVGIKWLHASDETKVFLKSRPDLSSQLQQKLKSGNTSFDTYLLFGCGEGSFTRQILQNTKFKGQWLGYEQITYLLEPHPMVFQFFLLGTDIVQSLKEKRLHIFLGPDCIDRFDVYLRTNNQARIPNKFLADPTYSQTTLLETAQNKVALLEQELGLEAMELKNKLADHYDSLPLDYWRKRFAEGKGLSVLSLTTRMSSFIQYCARDLIEGFRQTGHHAELLIEKDPLSTLRAVDILRAINDNKPDIFFIIDHLRQEYPWFPEKLPYFCWIQDMLPSLYKNRGHVLSPWDFIFTVNKTWSITLPENNNTFSDFPIEVLPVGCNESIFHPLTNSQKKYDVTYISHLFDIERTFEFFRDSSVDFTWNQEEQKMMTDGLITEQNLILYYGEITDLINKMSLNELTILVTETKKEVTKLFQNSDNDNSVSIPIPLIKYLTGGGQTRLFLDVMNRIKTIPLHILHQAGFSVAAWGNNWSLYRHLAKFSNGIADNSRQVNKIHNQSRINLNNSGGMSLHMRAIEVMASRAFMLSRRIRYDAHPLTDYFYEPDEVIYFDDEDDLPLKTEYYLRHEKERNLIAAAAYRKTINLFSYSNHAKRIIGSVKTRLHTSDMFGF